VPVPPDAPHCSTRSVQVRPPPETFVTSWLLAVATNSTYVWSVPPWIEAIVTGDVVPLPTTLSSRVMTPPPEITSLSPSPTFPGSVAPPANVTTLLPVEIEASPVAYRTPASVPMDR
jgi:hypothetical protein